MKITTLFLSLGIAHLGSAAPLSPSWEGLFDGPSEIEARHVPVTRLRDSRDSTRVGMASHVDASPHFDNRPTVPSKLLPPSVALTAPRPLHTAYLSSLSSSQQETQSEKSKSHDVPSSSPDSEDTKARDGQPEKYEGGKPASSPGSLLKDFYSDHRGAEKKPCSDHDGMQMSRLQSLPRMTMNVVLVGAVAAFVLLLLALEMLYRSVQGLRRDLGGEEGTIRLGGRERNLKDLFTRRGLSGSVGEKGGEEKEIE